jgi:hypothetical protein
VTGVVNGRTLAAARAPAVLIATCDKLASGALVKILALKRGASGRRARFSALALHPIINPLASARASFREPLKFTTLGLLSAVLAISFTSATTCSPSSQVASDDQHRGRYND